MVVGYFIGDFFRADGLQSVHFFFAPKECIVASKSFRKSLGPKCCTCEKKVHGIKGFVIPTKSFVKIGLTKIFCFINKMFSSIDKMFGYNNKKNICYP